MKAVVVGFGAMGKILMQTLGDSYVASVAPECEYKTLHDVKEEFDCIIDFSKPASLNMIYDFVKETHKPVVFATTGYTDEQLKMIDDLANYAPVLRSSNFSLGVILLNRLVKEITPILKDSYDIEVVEAHHNKKVDAPSGTAKMLVNTIVEETGFTVNEGRSGLCPRSKNEIGVSAIRGGTIVGEHEVMYCGEDEVITLKHSAYSKKIFAVGAIKAANWLIGKNNGFYNMDDVLFSNN